MAFTNFGFGRELPNTKKIQEIYQEKKRERKTKNLVTMLEESFVDFAISIRKFCKFCSLFSFGNLSRNHIFSVLYEEEANCTVNKLFQQGNTHLLVIYFIFGTYKTSLFGFAASLKVPNKHD